MKLQRKKFPEEESLSWKERQGGMCGGQEAEGQSTKKSEAVLSSPLEKAHENGPTKSMSKRIVKLLEQNFVGEN